MPFGKQEMGSERWRNRSGSHIQRQKCSLQLSDNGGLTEEPLPGRGTHIIEALARELGGCLHSKFGSDGTTVLLTFPRMGCQTLTIQNPRTDAYAPNWSFSHAP